MDRSFLLSWTFVVTFGCAGAPPPSGAATGTTQPEPGVGCLNATLAFHDDFESGDYSSWTDRVYGFDGSPCNTAEITHERVVSGTRASKSRITCAKPENHRNYGGVQFDGDDALTSYTNTGQGMYAEHGIVTQFSGWLDAGYEFSPAQWFSNFTVNGSCDYSERVITLGLNNADQSIGIGHVAETGGRVSYTSKAPAHALRRWVRTTVYVNYVKGEIAMWMDGIKHSEATFRRDSDRICQLHWGLYASGANTDVTYYEDDISVWKLEQPLPSFDREPFVDSTLKACP